MYIQLRVDSRFYDPMFFFYDCGCIDGYLKQAKTKGHARSLQLTFNELTLLQPQFWHRIYWLE